MTDDAPPLQGRCSVQRAACSAQAQRAGCRVQRAAGSAQVQVQRAIECGAAVCNAGAARRCSVQCAALRSSVYRTTR
eukprot:90058-Prymnesium_polylepis.1